ncbi:MAG: dienelactone hydrolase family protein [Spirochaetales bacterium]|nr:dienelactone hydrolase family protein [Spirochaetales bacterium]
MAKALKANIAHALFMGFILFCPDQGMAQDIVARAHNYTSSGEQFQGYLAYPANLKKNKKIPGILVIHEWWGHNEYVRHRARKLAELGYAALAIDMYGSGKLATHPAEARAFAQESLKSFPAAERRFRAALEELDRLPFVDPELRAAVGYCFGGGVALNMARADLPLKGVVSFHGGLAALTPARPGFKVRILVLHGADDAFVPPAQIAAFHREMKKAGAAYEFISYPGVKHAFTSRDADQQAKKFKLPVAYDSEADRRSWLEMQKFLEKILRPEQ